MPSGIAIAQPTVLVPDTFGGLSIYKNIDVDETGVLIKGGPGQIYGYEIYNASAAARYVKIYDKLTAPSVGTTTPVITIGLATLTARTLAIPQGIPFTLGIGIGATTGVADSDTGAPGTNDIVLTIYYK